MTTPTPEDLIAAELEKARTHFRRAVDALKQADALAEGYVETAEGSAKSQKRGLTEKEFAAARLHEEVHAIKEEAYDVFTQVASLEVRTRMPLGPVVTNSTGGPTAPTTARDEVGAGQPDTGPSDASAPDPRGTRGG